MDRTDSGASAAPAIAVQSIRKSFGATQALRGASFQVQAGRVHALLGENGAGKSTLVKMLSGLVRPDDGQTNDRGRAQRLMVVVVVVLEPGTAPVVPEWHTSTVFKADSASVREVYTLPPPTIVIVLVVGFCSTIWQRLVEVSCTI